MNRCGNRCKNLPTPPSLTVDAARMHPSFKHRLTPGAQCELDERHAGAHRNGGLLWNDPPVVYVGGERVW